MAKTDNKFIVAVEEAVDIELISTIEKLEAQITSIHEAAQVEANLIVEQIKLLTTEVKKRVGDYDRDKG